MTARIRLITQGDDCGSNHSANAAILEAYRRGILRNASLMAPCAGIVEAAALFAGEPGLCCGLHLTLNAEWDSVRWGPVLPPSAVPSLVDEDGRFFRTTQRLHDNDPKPSEILAEMQAQLDLVRSLGFSPVFADVHMGFTWVAAGLEEALDDWCARNGLLNAGRTYRPLPEVKTTGDPVERLIASLEAAAPGQYSLIGHPAYDDEEMRALGHSGYPGEAVAASRDWERLLFTDPRILRYCREQGVVPIRHDEAG